MGQDDEKYSRIGKRERKDDRGRVEMISSELPSRGQQKKHTAEGWQGNMAT